MPLFLTDCYKQRLLNKLVSRCDRTFTCGIMYAYGTRTVIMQLHFLELASPHALYDSQGVPYYSTTVVHFLVRNSN